MQRRCSALLIALAAVSTLLACTKPDPAAQTGAAPSASATASASPSPEPTANPIASGGTSTATAKDAADAGRAAEPAKKLNAASSGAAATSASAGPPECGTKPLPDCPLQAWMKSNANPPVMTSDLPGLATVLDKIVAFAPPGYTNWSSIAKDGGTAARSGDLAAAKASCRTCHDQYKQKYKTEIRARKL